MRKSLLFGSLFDRPTGVVELNVSVQTSGRRATASHAHTIAYAPDAVPSHALLQYLEKVVPLPVALEWLHHALKSSGGRRGEWRRPIDRDGASNIAGKAHTPDAVSRLSR